jgi:NAD(P)H dehydrogenase (quinone)
MKIYLLMAHPDTDSLSMAIADSYQKAAEAKGNVVRRQNLGELKFDPILWKGYHKIQTLEPDLLTAQENITWCEKWVIVYPVWWGSVPALLKGFLDRTLVPTFAFKYHEKGPFWDKLLMGRSAHLLTTSDSPKWWLYFMYRNSDVNMMKRAVLNFCGIKPVKLTRIGSVRTKKKEQILADLARVPSLV